LAKVSSSLLGWVGMARFYPSAQRFPILPTVL